MTTTTTTNDDARCAKQERYAGEAGARRCIKASGHPGRHRFSEAPADEAIQDRELHEDYPGQYISGPDFDTRDREGR